jgi:hypothetical protein
MPRHRAGSQGAGGRVEFIGDLLYIQGYGSVAEKDDENEEVETPVLRPLVWMGNSKRNLQAFPKDVRKLMGDELQLIQFGGMSKDAKPLKGIGSGVIEIALR